MWDDARTSSKLMTRVRHARVRDVRRDVACVRALKLRIGLARRLVKYAQRFIDSASEADVWPTGGLPVNLLPTSSLLVDHANRPLRRQLCI